MKGSKLNISTKIDLLSRRIDQLAHAIGIALDEDESSSSSSSLEPGERRQTKRSRSPSRSRSKSRSPPPRRPRSPVRRRQSDAQIWNAEGGSNHKDSYKVHFKKAAGVLLANTSVIREIFNNYGRVTHVYYLGNHGSVGFHSKDDCDNCLNAAKDIERNHGITVVPYVQTR
jgi:hypothetical protein